MIYTLTQVLKVVDGDSVNIACEGMVGRLEDDHAELVLRRTLLHCRLVTLDTPERGQEGYVEAGDDVKYWFSTHPFERPFSTVHLETYGRDNFGRMLTDFYVAGDRSNTLSQWMLRERGWLPWVPR